MYFTADWAHTHTHTHTRTHTHTHTHTYTHTHVHTHTRTHTHTHAHTHTHTHTHTQTQTDRQTEREIIPFTSQSHTLGDTKLDPLEHVINYISITQTIDTLHVRQLCALHKLCSFAVFLRSPPRTSHTHAPLARTHHHCLPAKDVRRQQTRRPPSAGGGRGG